MFWRFGGYAQVSSIDTILEKDGVQLEELLDESDLIQELKQQNSKLIEFLRDDAILKKLLTYVTAHPKAEAVVEDRSKKDNEKDVPKDDEKTTSAISFFGKGKGRSRSTSVKKDGEGETEQERKDAQRKKYAYVACEVLSSEVWSITEAVLEQREALRQFWLYMHQPAPLDPLIAGYFTKVNEALLDKKTEEMLAFFKSLEGIVPAMLQHVDCPMVMDLLLKIISLEKHEGGQGIVDWLQSQNLIPLLLAYLSPARSSAIQTSAGDFLKAIITISANATTQDQSVIGPNELTRQLVSESCIKQLISDMLKGGNPLTVGVGIVIEVIRKNNSDYDLDNQAGPEPKTSDPIYLGTLLRQFADSVPHFMHLIRSSSSKKPDLKAAFGGKIEPLGFDRFKTCELMAELLHCSNMGLLNERGAEEEVAKRDAERERLKAEGKLATPKAPTSPSHENSHDEFGSSVDSHGFHHAERPSDDEMDEKPEDTRKVEVQNASDEDGFEKVNVPGDEMPDEVTFDDLNEKIDSSTHGGLPLLEKVEKRDPSDPSNQSPVSPSAIPPPLSPKKGNFHFDPPPTQAADSPTTAGVTDKINSLDVDEDTVMSEFGEEPTHEDDGPSELERALARPEDKPAPLNFSKKEPASQDSTPTTSQHGSESSQDLGQSTATLQAPEASTLSNGERPPFDTEVDGTPVVGDLLKIQFVKHQVVPTILDFFFRFPWNNFLHNVVYDVVQQVFNGTLDRGYNRTLAFDLFHQIERKDGKTVEDIGLRSGKDITDRILDGQAASDESQKHKGMRLGYMGHLTLIAEEVCKFGSRNPPEPLDHTITERVNREEWMRYVEGTLAETRDKDNAVLGGVRPENAVGVRAMGAMGGGMSGGFTSNTNSTLANAGLSSGSTPADTLALQEGTVGQSFEINSGTMLSGFGDGEDDEEMEDEAIVRERERRAAFAEDEQNAQRSPDANKSGASVAPLNFTPSRARQRLAARLAEKNQNATDSGDPDAADATAVETASMLPEEPSELDHPLGASNGSEDAGLQITGMRTLPARFAATASASKFSGLFSSSDDSSEEDDEEDSDDYDEDEAGRDETLLRRGGDYETEDEARRRRRRRPSTTEAKERTPLDSDDDEDLELGGVGGRTERLVLDSEPPGTELEDDDDSSEDELVEIARPAGRRTS